MSTLALSLKLSAVKTLSAVQRAINILKSAGPGAWYDPSDIASYTAAVGPELITNGTFDADTGWVKDAGWTISGGRASCDGSTGLIYAQSPTPTLTVGKTYLASFNIVSRASGTVYLPYDGTGVVAPSVATGYASYIFTCNNESKPLVYSSAFVGSIDNISVKELTGLSACTMFQDSAGTTPVTAVEQPVGLMLDKSQGLVLGAELATPLSALNWAVAGNDATHVVTFSGGAARYQSDTTSPFLYVACVAIGSTIPAGTYLLTVTCSNWVSGSVKFLDVGGTGALVVDKAGTFTSRISVPANSPLGFSRNDANVDLTISSVSLKAIPGNHLIQPTATSRPTLSSRYNLLTKTEQFDDAVWFKGGYGGGLPPTVIANDASGPASDGFADKVTFSAGAGAQSLLYATAAFSPAVYRGVLCLKAASPGDVGKIIGLRHATAGAYLLITLTADYQVISRNETSPTAWVGSLDMALRPDVGTSSGEVSIHLAYASLTTAADAALPYQRVNTATDYDYDFSKFPPYLKFDGVDDSMYSAASVDFTSTDKMTVFAGVHKVGTASGAVLETSANSDSNNGSFSYFSGAWLDARDYFSTRGTVLGYPSLTVTPPATYVIAAASDIPGDLITVRANASQVANSSADLGTGNFGNYPLYVGRRNNANLPFSGRLYQLALKGRAMTAAEISTLESYINSKTKAY